MVSPSDRGRTVSDCRHLVADGNGDAYDYDFAWGEFHETGIGGSAFLWGGCSGGGRSGQGGEGGGAGEVSHSQTVALDVAFDLWRCREVCEDVLE